MSPAERLAVRETPARQAFALDQTKPSDHLGIADVSVTRAPTLLPTCTNARAAGAAEGHLTSLNALVRQ